MRRTLTALLLLLAFAAHAQARSSQSPLVFTHVTVIDATGGPIKRDMTVVVIGDRITELGPSRSVRAPQDARVVDASRKFLIPGLWDMHVHWYDDDYLPLFTANGVTGVRLMSGAPQHLQWRIATAAGTIVGPRIAAGSPIVDGPQPVWHGSLTVSDAEEGEQVVSFVKSRGWDFVKVYSLLPRDAYFGIAKGAKSAGVPFAGHVPESVSAAEASDAGQKSIEHLTGILLACSTQERELRAARIDALGKPDVKSAMLPIYRAQAQQLLDTFSSEKAAALFAKFIKNGTWQCPTLTVLRSTSSAGEQNRSLDPRIKYIPRAIVASWDPTKDPRFAARTEQDWAIARKTYQRSFEIVGMMRRAGVPIIAGTDTLNPYCFPGFSLHDELALLVEAGLTAMEALQAATRNPAEFFGTTASFGTIEKGKIADLVLLDANPLDDIHNTKRIDSVVQGGKLYSRAELDAMLAACERRASQ